MQQVTFPGNEDKSKGSPFQQRKLVHFPYFQGTELLAQTQDCSVLSGNDTDGILFAAAAIANASDLSIIRG